MDFRQNNAFVSYKLNYFSLIKLFCSKSHTIGKLWLKQILWLKDIVVNNFKAKATKLLNVKFVGWPIFRV